MLPKPLVLRYAPACAAAGVPYQGVQQGVHDDLLDGGLDGPAGDVSRSNEVVLTGARFPDRFQTSVTPVGGLKSSVKGLREDTVPLGPFASWGKEMKMIAVLIDGGHVRVLAKQAGHQFRADFLEQVGASCAVVDEEIHRILFYDCAPYGEAKPLPVSGQMHQFQGTDHELRELARRPLFAVRRGVLKFRGWVPKRIPIAGRGQPLTDTDFKPQFEQKGVDMRIGLDMANYAANRSVKLLALVTNDTDCIPAMKYARRAGLQVALVCVPGYRPANELLAHCDFRRDLKWPQQPVIKGAPAA